MVCGFIPINELLKGSGVNDLMTKNDDDDGLQKKENGVDGLTKKSAD